MDCKLFITNAQRLDVRELTFYNVIIQDAGIDNNGQAEAESDRSDVTMSAKFEHYSLEFKNL